MKVSEAEQRVVLITGGAVRIGAALAGFLHAKGFRLILHYHRSSREADSLCNIFNSLRDDSASILEADLLNLNAVDALANQARQRWGRLDVLINNASSFYPTPLQEIEEHHWIDLMGTNALAPLKLCKALQASLRETQGSIINLTDISAASGRSGYVIYAMAKAALANLTRSLARELAPEVRVNAVAPGFILPAKKPDTNESEEAPADPLTYSCLNYPGQAVDVAHAVNFLINQSYITGQTLNVDGGRRLKI